jgi:hypothetical protein
MPSRLDGHNNRNKQSAGSNPGVFACRIRSCPAVFFSLRAPCLRVSVPFFIAVARRQAGEQAGSASGAAVCIRGQAGRKARLFLCLQRQLCFGRGEFIRRLFVGKHAGSAPGASRLIRKQAGRKARLFHKNPWCPCRRPVRGAGEQGSRGPAGLSLQACDRENGTIRRRWQARRPDPPCRGFRPGYPGEDSDGTSPVPGQVAGSGQRSSQTLKACPHAKTEENHRQGRLRHQSKTKTAPVGAATSQRTDSDGT